MSNLFETIETDSEKSFDELCTKAIELGNNIYSYFNVYSRPRTSRRDDSLTINFDDFNIEVKDNIIRFKINHYAIEDKFFMQTDEDDGKSVKVIHCYAGDYSYYYYKLLDLTPVKVDGYYSKYDSFSGTSKKSKLGVYVNYNGVGDLSDIKRLLTLTGNFKRV